MDIQIDVPFDLVELGAVGDLHLIPKDLKNNLFPRCTLPFGPPPIIPDLKNQIEDFLHSPEKLPIHDLEHAQRHWPREPNPGGIFKTDLCPLGTELQVERNPTTGQVMGFTEMKIVDAAGTSKNSLSLRRLPGPPSEAIRGSVTNYPFLPGGMDELIDKELELLSAEKVSFESDLLMVPPGFKCGMDFSQPAVKPDVVLVVKDSDKDVINLASIWSGDEFMNIVENKDQGYEKTEETKVVERVTEDLENQAEELEKVIPKEIPVLKISETSTEVIAAPTKWVEQVNSSKPVPDFHKKIPKMAYEYDFELDPFQQHAIYLLEKQESVFVAAHTSAGKTVVAEYAIALAQKHKTRAIYTSPIKALSNQKFRDFKRSFEDVGLLTGDIQINPKAACLIMTTEILRSMLYKGADTVRELEWVIFDEVHYVNDTERGVVWEEVLIMLMQHVNIVMLSATVPNVMDFASWVGRTKQKKIHVISTLTRPVPLEHYLYTGGKSKNELFVIVKEEKFLKKGYLDAVEAKKTAKTKFATGGKGGLTPKQEATIWQGLVGFLEKKSQLPVVAFTLSRKRCDTNSDLLHCMDLTTSLEKSKIHITIQKSLQRLKEDDRNLPQIKRVIRLLDHGIGVHHSGILPFLKEVVEILFHDGLVKLLFATETFAMGVNMPARTVVFDSVEKHDGVNFRELRPSEYIQMAGRAGRRGLDTIGMVIILCKRDVPESSALENMMTGKPTKLESKFRLTYTMILNILRVEHLSVEGIIKKSFSEVPEQMLHSKYKQKLKELEMSANYLQEVTCRICKPDIEQFCDNALELLKLKREIHTMMSSALTVGRVVVVNYKSQGSTLALLLKTSSQKFSMLVLTEPQEEEEESLTSAALKQPFVPNKPTDVDEKQNESNSYFHAALCLVKKKLFYPDTSVSHAVFESDPDCIIDITKFTVKVETEKIINDWMKRQQERFRFDPPGNACNAATQELLRLSEDNIDGLPEIDYARDLNVKNLKTLSAVDKLDKLKELQSNIMSHNCISCETFELHLQQELSNLALKKELNSIKFHLSDESLKSIPDYKARLEVLKELGYINNEKHVEMKGQVACVISNHELLVTELICEDILTNLKPEEIAALLSCLVFQQKPEKEDMQDLTPTLKEGIGKITDIAKKIDMWQKHHRVDASVHDFLQQFSFGLTGIVYKWAQKVHFAEIASMTQVQEGIIVRCIQRLDELLRDIKMAANIVGNPILSQKMEEASNCIKRDIVFAASLYTQ